MPGLATPRGRPLGSPIATAVILATPARAVRATPAALVREVAVGTTTAAASLPASLRPVGGHAQAAVLAVVAAKHVRAGRGLVAATSTAQGTSAPPQR